jgi:hypothetical protein
MPAGIVISLVPDPGSRCAAAGPNGANVSAATTSVATIARMTRSNFIPTTSHDAAEK